MATFDGSQLPVVYNTNTVTNAVNRTYAEPTYMALADSSPSPEASVGYAGSASDGLTQLDTFHGLPPYDSRRMATSWRLRNWHRAATARSRSRSASAAPRPAP